MESKYKKSLGIMIVVLSIVLLSAMLLLAVELSISPIFGIVVTAIVMFLIIRFTPEKYMIHGTIRRTEMDS